MKKNRRTNTIFRVGRNENEITDMKEVISIFEIDKADENSSFPALLNEVFSFQNIKVYNLSPRQTRYWDEFKRKIDIMYDTPSYENIYSKILLRFSNSSVLSDIEPETPLAFIFGYSISQKDTCSFFYQDGCLLPPLQDLRKSNIQECETNFIKLRRVNGNQIFDVRPIKENVPTQIFVTDQEEFYGLSDFVSNSLLKKGISKITIFKINPVTKRFDMIFDNYSVETLSSMLKQKNSETREICTKKEKNSFPFVFLAGGIFLFLVLIVAGIFMYRSSSVKSKQKSISNNEEIYSSYY